MKKTLRLFVVSDIHGYCTLLTQALAEAGFDENDEDHLFVFCGDLFDRGRENRKVYDYVRQLKHKILIRGNHDERLAEIIRDGRANIYDLRNGVKTTLEEFFGPGAVDDDGRLSVGENSEMAEELLSFIGGMGDYYETEHYVFTHGWLPLQPECNVSYIREDWRGADNAAWHYARFLEWQLLYSTPARLPGKTIVCGHRPTQFAHFFDPRRDRTDSGVFYGSGMIAIDAGTVRSGRVNVLVLEEETA